MVEVNSQQACLELESESDILYIMYFVRKI